MRAGSRGSFGLPVPPTPRIHTSGVMAEYVCPDKEVVMTELESIALRWLQNYTEHIEKYGDYPGRMSPQAYIRACVLNGLELSNAIDHAMQYAETNGGI